MTDEQINPFQSPEAEQAPQKKPRIQSGNQKKLDEQLLALVALWAILGLLSIASGVVLVFFMRQIGFDTATDPESKLMGVLLFVYGFLWFPGVIGAARKKIWGLYLGLGVSYFSLLVSAPLLIQSYGMISIGVISAFISLIIQGHRVIKWAKTAKPVEAE